MDRGPPPGHAQQIQTARPGTTSMDPPLPSLLLQVALYFTGWYLVLLYISEIALLVYKGERDTTTVSMVTRNTSHNNLPRTIKLYLIVTSARLTHIFKYTGLALPYPTRNFWPELLLLLMLAGLDMIRIFFG